MRKTPSVKRISCWIAAALLILLFIQACGKKGDPVPPRLVPPPQVSDLRAFSGKGLVHLSWALPDEKADVVRVKILRNDPEMTGETCPGCPVMYETIADTSTRDERIQREGGARMTYVDEKVKAGRLYRYRIVFCDSYGNCGGESNTAEIKVQE